MKRHLTITTIFLLALSFATHAQVPVAVGVSILKAEDARRYDAVLESLLKSPNADIRARAALAAGRIGDERAIPALYAMFGDRKNTGRVWTMAVFALGEIESVKGAEYVSDVIKSESDYALRDRELLSRAFEAAGKIAAAHAADPEAKTLGEVIIKGLELERNSGTPSPVVICRALTAILRAKPTGAEDAVRPFLASTDPNVVADALNTLARLRAKGAIRDARDLLTTHTDAVVRANAARVLGAAEDKDAFDILLKAATTDTDSRVRVSAIRSLASLKDAKALDGLVERGIGLLADMNGLEPKAEKSELLEIASALARIVPNSNNEKAIGSIQGLRVTDNFRSPEAEIAMATVAPARYVADFRLMNSGYGDRHIAESYIQGIRVIAASKDEALKLKARDALMAFVAGMKAGVKPAYHGEMTKAQPELQGAVAAFKPDNLDQMLRDSLANDDLYIRAAAAGAIDDRPLSKENVEALKKAFTFSFVQDKESDDAQLAILNALHKLDKKESVGALLIALDSPDYLVRKRAFELLADKDLQKDFPGIPASLENARSKHKDQVLPYSPVLGTKLGQVLNTDVDYRRALSRKNGSVKAVLTTDKGVFTIFFTPEEAPLTVDNFVKLARSGYFNGLEVHRVVPNFVMQDGDPRGDGNGGPGWSIRCEVNTLPYDRGAVGMALSGKDTGGSQWFVTHAPQPHLDGGYTVFGHVNNVDMKVVDNIVRGDKIVSVKIVEGNLPQRTQSKMSKK